jgi:multiubiquitin
MTDSEEKKNGGQDHKKEFTIIVNARKKEVAAKELSFDQVVALAFSPVPTGPNVMFTITYRHGPKENRDGSLLEGGTVEIKNEMVFNVTQTDKS